MPAATTDLLIGSYPNLPAQTLSITQGATTEPHDVAAGSYYLYDDHSAFDLLDAVGAAINAHSLVSGAVFEIRLNRRIQVTASQSFSLTWPADGVLRDLLGFTGNLTPAATSHVATNISPLLWSAAKVARYEARLGAEGKPVHDTAVGQSATGIVRSTRHNTIFRNTLSWRYVQNARIWTTSEAGGEFFAFWRDVLSKHRRFRVWRGIQDDDSSTATNDISGDASGVLPASGGSRAYIFAGNANEFPYDREFGFHEYTHPVTIPVVTTPEYTS